MYYRSAINMVKKVKVEDFKRVSENEVPTVVRVQTPWEEIFRSIKKGEAIIIEPDQIAASTVRGALNRYKKKGKFKNLEMVTRKVAHKKYRSYIVNPSEKKSE